jgi:hypothetical protein
MTKITTMAVPWISGDDGRTSQSSRPTAEPQVPGATGTYPTPSAVATARANTWGDRCSGADADNVRRGQPACPQTDREGLDDRG